MMSHHAAVVASQRQERVRAPGGQQGELESCNGMRSGVDQLSRIGAYPPCQGCPVAKTAMVAALPAVPSA